MNYNLSALIEEIQIEYNFLEDEMKRCIREDDFSGAEGLKNALFYTEQQLRTLKNLDDPDFDEKLYLREVIERMRQSIRKDEMTEASMEFTKSRIAEYERKLSKLEKEERRFHLDSDYLMVCFEKMLKGDLEGFILEFLKGQVNIEISKKDTGLEIKVKSTTDKSLEYFITQPERNELKKMGFYLEEGVASRKLVSFDSSKIHLALELLARIVYDVFRQYGNKKAVIKYADDSGS